MAGRSTRQTNPIGIDLSDGRLRAAQLELLDDGVALVDQVAYDAAVSSDEDLREGIARMLAEHQFQGTHVATSVPSSQLLIHHVRLQGTPQAKAGQAVQDEVAARLGKDAAGAVVRTIEVATGNGRDATSDYIAFVTSREVVEQHLRVAEKLGLQVVGISALPLAIGHAFSYLGRQEDQAGLTYLVVHFDTKVTHLVILHEGELRFARSIPLGVYDILEAAAQAGGVEAATMRDDLQYRITHPDGPAEAVQSLPYELAGRVVDDYVEEIVSCLGYFAATVSPRCIDKVVFAGEMANDYDFCQLVASRIGLPARVGDALEGVQVPVDDETPHTDPRRPHPELAVAVGLSLFGAEVN